MKEIRELILIQRALMVKAGIYDRSLTEFSLLAQSVSVSGGDDDFNFSAHHLRSGRQIKNV